MGMKNDCASKEIRALMDPVLDDNLQEGIDPKRKKAPEGQVGTSGHGMDQRVTESYHKRRVSSPLSGA